MERLELSIIQDDCTSCGQCPEIAPKYFYMDQKSGIAHVKDAGAPEPDTPRYQGLDGVVGVAQEDVADVIEAVEECPVSCIYIQIGQTAVLSA